MEGYPCVIQVGLPSVTVPVSTFGLVDPSENFYTQTSCAVQTKIKFYLLLLSCGHEVAQTLCNDCMITLAGDICDDRITYHNIQQENVSHQTEISPGLFGGV